MDTKTITDALRAFEPEAHEWIFAVYRHAKTRDGVTLDWTGCPMDGAPGWTARIRDELLKTVQSRAAGPYSPFLSDKEYISVLDRDDELIRERLFDVTAGIRSSQPARSDAGTGRTTGYAFLSDGDDPVLFMRRANPFISASKAGIWLDGGKGLSKTSSTVARLTPAADFVMIGASCLIFSSAVEKDFEIASRQAAVAAERVGQITATGLLGDPEFLGQTALSAKNARKFRDFDPKILERIARLGFEDRMAFLDTYGISIDVSGKIDTSGQEGCELLIDLLCARSCIDPLGRLSVASGLVPRE